MDDNSFTMKRFAGFLICIICCACRNETVSVGMGNLIDLSYAIRHKQPIKLSSIADSATFIPLETREDALIGNKAITFSEEYIFNGDLYFDWEGTFLGKIGREGRGPGEDLYKEVIYLNNHFYSKGSKFIEYDNVGRYTGKERSFYTGGLTDYAIGKLMNVAAFTNTKRQIVVYNYPDSVFFLNTDFNITAGSKVLDYSPGHWINRIDLDLIKFTSRFKDTLLFYNFFNDTIYRVSDSSLVPKWVVHIDQEIRTPNDFLYRYEQLLSAAAQAWLKGNVENSELIQLTDRTHMVLNAQETDHYLFFMLQEVRLYARYRDAKNIHPFMAYYNKATGEIAATEEQGFEDDLTGLGYFLPKYGIHNNKMISTILPHQLHSFIETAREDGKPVNPLLIRLAEKVMPNDNPVLMIVHLKE